MSLCRFNSYFIKNYRQLQALLAVFAVALALARAGVAADADQSVFAKTRDSLVIVTTGQGAGSGFVARIDGNKYLVSNEHVLRGGPPLSARLLDGRRLSFLSLEVAADRDLVRLELAEVDAAALDLPAGLPDIGQPVWVFGNSEGGQVITSLSGKLLGIGPELLETDAPFVKGNSGSPIVDGKGGVIGVATFAVLPPAPDDWLNQGTRFGEVRRFGVRLNGATWRKIDRDQYFARTEVIADIETFCLDLFNLRFTDRFIDANTGLPDYRYERESRRYRRSVRLCKLLADMVASLNLMVAQARDANYHKEQALSSRTRGEFDDHKRRMTMNRMLATAKHSEYVAAYKKVYTDASNFMRGTDWYTKSMKDDVESWLKVLKALAERGAPE